MNRNRLVAFAATLPWAPAAAVQGSPSAWAGAWAPCPALKPANTKAS